jgi:hypothetical protein
MGKIGDTSSQTGGGRIEKEDPFVRKFSIFVSSSFL